MSERERDDLKAQVANLEARVRKLESNSASKSGAESMRMILIGPPGAGEQLQVQNCDNQLTQGR